MARNGTKNNKGGGQNFGQKPKDVGKKKNKGGGSNSGKKPPATKKELRKQHEEASWKEHMSDIDCSTSQNPSESLGELFRPIGVCPHLVDEVLVETDNEDDGSEPGNEEVEAIDKGSAVGNQEGCSILKSLRAAAVAQTPSPRDLDGDNTMVDVAVSVLGEGLSRDVASVDIAKNLDFPPLHLANNIRNANGKAHQSLASTSAPPAEKDQSQNLAPVDAPAPKTPWRDLFGDNRKRAHNLKFHDSPEEEVVVEATLEAIKEVKIFWGHALIGYIAGSNPGNGAIIGCCKSWKVKFNTIFDSSGWVIIKFNNEDDRDKVLEGGPYLIYGRPFMLKIMPPLFSFDDRELAKVPIWVKLPHLPLELWNEDALSKIASKIGIPIQTDNITMTKKRFTYARVLVEVDLEKDLTKEIKIRVKDRTSFVQNVIYEFVPNFCKFCKVMGHNTATCERNIFMPSEPLSTDPRIEATCVDNTIGDNHQVEANKEQNVDSIINSVQINAIVESVNKGKEKEVLVENAVGTTVTPQVDYVASSSKVMKMFVVTTMN